MNEVGFGTEEITPPTGTPLSGFIFRENKPSTGIDDPLFVRVMAIRSTGGAYLLAVYDLLGLGTELTERILAELEEKLGEACSRQRVELVATHNHSGPPAVHLEGEAAPDPAYVERVAQATVRAASIALQRLQPAHLHLASTSIPELTYNRRALLADGRVSMALEPDGEVVERGPLGNTLTLLVWKDGQGRNIAGVVHFPSHGVAMCTQAISADIPGQISNHMGAILKAPCLFLQGAAGDVNPVVVSSTREPMLAWVERWIALVHELSDQLLPMTEESLKCASLTLALDYAPLPDRGTVERQVAELEQVAAGDVTSPEVQNAIRSLGNIMNVRPGELPEVSKAAHCAKTLAGSGRLTLAAIDRGKPLLPCPLHVALWQFGELVLAFTAAELFARTGVRLRALSQKRIILPVTYASPLIGYIPDRESMDKGGYEVDNGWQFYGHPAPFLPEAEEKVLQAVRELMEKVR